MIRVTVEVIPGGDESKKRTHCIAEISNTGKESADTKGQYGSYKAKFYQNELYTPSKVWRSGDATHLHRRLRGAWDILFCCLYNAGLYDRNKSVLIKDEPVPDYKWRDVPNRCTLCEHILRRRIGDSFDRGEKLSCRLAKGKVIDGYADHGELKDPPPEWCPLANSENT